MVAKSVSFGVKDVHERTLTLPLNYWMTLKKPFKTHFSHLKNWAYNSVRVLESLEYSQWYTYGSLTLRNFSIIIKKVFSVVPTNMSCTFAFHKPRNRWHFLTTLFLVSRNSSLGIIDLLTLIEEKINESQGKKRTLITKLDSIQWELFREWPLNSPKSVILLEFFLLLKVG